MVLLKVLFGHTSSRGILVVVGLEWMKTIFKIILKSSKDNMQKHYQVRIGSMHLFYTALFTMVGKNSNNKSTYNSRFN